MDESQVYNRLVTEYQIPTLRDVFAARRVIERFLRPTPLIRPAGLSEALGCEAYVKCENLQPIGAFKIRGGLNLMASLSAEERRAGVCTASTGNHGQSIAYAAREFGCRATIFAPAEANPLKVQAMRRLGAQIILTGRDFDEARLACEREAQARGARYIHSANEPLLIAGVATATLEMLEEAPDLEVVIVPLGGGSGACGACIAGKGVNPKLRVVGVQAEGAPVVYQSLKQGRLTETERIDTFAEGLATRVAFELPFTILSATIDEVVLVSDAEMRRAMALLMEQAHVVAEGAGAASTAAAAKLRDQLRGRKVGLVLSGGNATLPSLREAIETAERLAVG